ncbi:hypothetical protein [Cupriavidus oxalaticus]|uniref:hypothetical protein n=1 Tax=Cupriavidus oxalaticus TaxID=96344 RepID=UPI003F7315AE
MRAAVAQREPAGYCAFAGSGYGRTMRAALATSETAEPAHWTAMSDGNVIIARELAAMLEQLDTPPSPLFKRYLDTLPA